MGNWTWQVFRKVRCRAFIITVDLRGEIVGRFLRFCILICVLTKRGWKYRSIVIE